MKEMKHLNIEKIEDVAHRLWKVSSALDGLASLFFHQSNESILKSNEYVGIAHLIQELSRESAILEDILRCGYDSNATRE